jgi:hypothetical protein
VRIRWQLTGNQRGRQINDGVTGEAGTEEILASALTVHQFATRQRMLNAEAIEWPPMKQTAAAKPAIAVTPLELVPQPGDKTITSRWELTL